MCRYGFTGTDFSDTLVESEKYYRFLLGGVSHIIWAVDIEAFRLTYVSPNVENLSGYAPDEVLNLSLKNIISRESMALVLDVVNREMEREKSGSSLSQTLDVRINHKNGKKVWVEVSSHFLRDPKRRVTGLSGIARDCSERIRVTECLRQTEEELRRTCEELKAKVAEKSAALSSKTESLKEVHTALNVLLGSRAQDAKEIENIVTFNIRETVSPFIHKLKQSGLNTRQKAWIDILEENLTNITRHFAGRPSLSQLMLTPTEIHVAALIKQGKATKEIAGQLGLAKSTIDFHRNNIRKKLRITNKNVNLKTFLQLAK